MTKLIIPNQDIDIYSKGNEGLVEDFGDILKNDIAPEVVIDIDNWPDNPMITMLAIIHSEDTFALKKVAYGKGE